VPDPEAAVDPAVRTETLERVLATAVAPPRPRRPLRPRPLTARRAALATGATVAAIGALLVAGERSSGPERFAVLPALADDLSREGRILHVLDRTVRLGSDGEPRGGVHEEESWELLDDVAIKRYRIGTGQDAEQMALDRRGYRDYDARSNTVRVVRQPTRGAPVPVEPPAGQMARDAASGKIPVAARPVVNGRRTLKIEVDDGAWYIAQDAPELVRHELRLPGGGIQRTDYVAFEVLHATPANRKLLQIQAPPNARVVPFKPPPYRPQASVPRPSAP